MVRQLANTIETCTKPEDPGEEGNQILSRVFRIVLEYNRVNIKESQKIVCKRSIGNV